MTNHSLSVRQIQVLFFLDLLGISMLYLPSMVAKWGGGYCAVWLGCGVLVWALFGAMAAECSGKELTQSGLGRVLLLFFAGKNLLQGAVWLRLMAGSLSVLLLPKTPLVLTEGTMVLLLWYGVTKGPACRGRAAEVLLLPVVLILFAVCAFSMAGVELEKLVPSAPVGAGKTIGLVALSGFGVENVLFASAFCSQKKAGKAVALSGVLLALVLAALTALSYAVFGGTGMTIRRYPLLQLMDTIDFPLLFVERQDVWMVGVWLWSVFLFLWSCLFFCGWQFAQVVQRGKERWYALGAAVVMLALAQLVVTEAAAMFFLQGLLWMNGLSLILILGLFLKERSRA